MALAPASDETQSSTDDRGAACGIRALAIASRRSGTLLARRPERPTPSRPPRRPLPTRKRKAGPLMSICPSHLNPPQYPRELLDVPLAESLEQVRANG